MYRIGQGYDVHAFEISKPLVLGGVTIPFPKGLKAHSDGDVVIHSICDALLGAAALGDIGHHFPDTDNRFKNIDSRILLKQVGELLKEKKYGISNIDATIIAEAPKLSPYVAQMRKNIAEDLQTTLDNVNIKATTNEKIGFIGREEGIATLTNVLISINDVA